jgi:hypothetical protein
VEVERFACKYGFKWGGVKTEEQANFVIPHARTHIRATGIETYVVSFIRRRAYN